MARILFIATQGSENPTRATIPFILAKGAVEGGHKPEIVLAGDASVLARRTLVENVQGVGFPSLMELFNFAVENQIPVYT